MPNDYLMLSKRAAFWFRRPTCVNFTAKWYYLLHVFHDFSAPAYAAAGRRRNGVVRSPLSGGGDPKEDCDSGRTVDDVTDVMVEPEETHVIHLEPTSKGRRYGSSN